MTKSFHSIIPFLILASAAHAALDEMVLKTPIFSRTISAGAGILKTTKMEVYGEQILAQPSVEFMLDLDVDGEPIILAPSDFEIKGIDRATSNRTTRTEIALKCKQDRFPLTVYVRYFTNPDLPYIEKSVMIKPLKRIEGATLLRVVIEDFVLKPSLRIGNLTAFDPKSGKGIYFFAASLFGKEYLSAFSGLVLSDETDHPLDSSYETGRMVIGTAPGGIGGLCQGLTDFLREKYSIAREGNRSGACLDVTLGPSSERPTEANLAELRDKCRDLRKQHPDQPLCLVLDRPIKSSDAHLLNTVDLIRIDCSKAGLLDYRSSRCSALRILPIGAVRFTPPLIPAGTPLAEAKAMVVASLSDMLPPVDSSSDLAGYLEKARAFKERFAKYLAVYQSIFDCPTGNTVDGEAHLVGNSGFFLLFNPAGDPVKVALPLSAVNLNLKGELILSDWTSLDAGAPIRTVRATDNVELEIAPRSAMVIGVNIDSGDRSISKSR